MKEMSRVSCVALLLVIVSVIRVSGTSDTECYHTSNNVTYYRTVLDDSKTYCFDSENAEVVDVTSGCDCAAKAESLRMNSFMMVSDTQCELYRKVATAPSSGKYFRSEDRIVYSVLEPLPNSYDGGDEGFVVIPGWQRVDMHSGTFAWHFEETCDIDNIHILYEHKDQSFGRVGVIERADIRNEGSYTFQSQQLMNFQCISPGFKISVHRKYRHSFSERRWTNDHNSTSFGDMEGHVDFYEVDRGCLAVTDISTDYAHAEAACQQAGGTVYGKPFSDDFKNKIEFDNDMWLGLEHAEGVDAFVWNSEHAEDGQFFVWNSRHAEGVDAFVRNSGRTNVPYDDAAWTNPADTSSLSCAYANSGGSPFNLTAADCAASHRAMCVVKAAG